MSVLRNLLALVSDDVGTGSVDRETMAFRATPWIEREDESFPLYTGRDRSVWLYGVVRNFPLHFEDDRAILDSGAVVERVLDRIGETSLSRIGRLSSTAAYRDIHVISIRWEGPAEMPAGTPTPAQAAFLEDALDGLKTPSRATFIGVRLQNLDAAAAARSRSMVDMGKDLLAMLIQDRTTDYPALESDRAYLAGILRHNECRPPTAPERRQLEAWFNDGRHAEPELIRLNDRLVVDSRHELEFVALERFQERMYQPPGAMWIADVLNHPAGPDVVSLRAELKSGGDTKKDLGRAVHRKMAQIQEDREGGARVDRDQEELAGFTEAVADEFSSGRAPSLTGCSILFGRKLAGRGVGESFVEYLENAYGIVAKPLHHRQMLALDEVQPCSRVRCSPYPQDLNAAMIAYSGLNSFTTLGDEHGAYIGLGLPDGTPVYHNPMEPARQDKPPVTYICGRPGSGKTMLMQMLALQTVLMGQRVIFMNPKGYDTLMPLVDMVNQETDHNAERLSLAELSSEQGGGAFDPFRYVLNPKTAATVAANYITTVIDLDQSERTALRAGLNRGAVAGARCVGEALEFVDDRAVVDLTMDMWSSTPLFQLAIGTRAKPRFDDADLAGGLVLIEFDVDIDLPARHKEVYSDAERIALAAVRCVTAASVGILSLSKGGLFAMDEAHTILNNPDTLHQLLKIMREGRSLFLELLMASQQASDLLRNNASNFISRVFAMASDDDDEARAVIELMGLEPTDERVAMLRRAGPVRRTADHPGRPAASLHKDLWGRRSAMLHPVPDRLFKAFSTNVEERREREAAGETLAAAQG
jgi:hypothetical protein